MSDSQILFIVASVLAISKNPASSFAYFWALVIGFLLVFKMFGLELV